MNLRFDKAQGTRDACILSLERAMADMNHRLQGQEKTVQTLHKQVEDLEVRTGKNSRNPSKPPLSDSFFDRSRRKTKRKKSGRTKGIYSRLARKRANGRMSCLTLAFSRASM